MTAEVLFPVEGVDEMADGEEEVGKLGDRRDAGGGGGSRRLVVVWEDWTSTEAAGEVERKDGEFPTGAGAGGCVALSLKNEIGEVVRRKGGGKGDSIREAGGEGPVDEAVERGEIDR